MKKLVNHVDHVAYISKWENLDANIAHLEAITGATLQRTLRPQHAAMICVDWSAGLEVAVPLPERCEANKRLYDRLETHGEGVVAVIFGVENLEAHKAKLEAKGYESGPLMGGTRGEPWTDILLRERHGPPAMGVSTVFSEIDYEDHLIRFVDVKEAPPGVASQKFINHVDHVAYLSSWENLDANIAHLEAITGATLERTPQPEQGALICVDWSAGLEVVAPLPEAGEEGQMLRDRLETHGEGVVAVVYGVEDLEAHMADLGAKGYYVGPLMGGVRGEPWSQILLRERFGPPVMDTFTVFSQIDYDDGLIRFVDVREMAQAD